MTSMGSSLFKRFNLGIGSAFDARQLATSLLSGRKERRNERSEFSQFRETIATSLRFEESTGKLWCIASPNKHLHLEFECMGVFVSGEAISISGKEAFGVEIWDADIMHREGGWMDLEYPSYAAKPLAMTDDSGKTAVFASRPYDERERFFSGHQLENLFRCMRTRSYKTFSSIVKIANPESKMENLQRRHFCMVMLKKKTARIHNRDEPTILSFMVFDRRPVLRTCMTMSVVQDIFASRSHFCLSDVLYWILCRTDEHRMKAYDMKVLLDALETTTTTTTECFRTMVRELLHVYPANVYRKLNTKHAALVVRNNLRCVDGRKLWTLIMGFRAKRSASCLLARLPDLCFQFIFQELERTWRRKREYLDCSNISIKVFEHRIVYDNYDGTQDLACS